MIIGPLIWYRQTCSFLVRCKNGTSMVPKYALTVLFSFCRPRLKAPEELACALRAPFGKDFSGSRTVRHRVPCRRYYHFARQQAYDFAPAARRAFYMLVRMLVIL